MENQKIKDNRTLPLGKLVVTSSVNCDMTDPNFDQFVQASLKRHKNCDWGEMDYEEDRRQNDRSFKTGERIISVYKIPEDFETEQEKIWIITERDRSVTTVLFPDGY